MRKINVSDKEFIKLYNKSKVEEMMEMFNCSRARIYQIANKLGIYRGHSRRLKYEVIRGGLPCKRGCSCLSCLNNIQSLPTLDVPVPKIKPTPGIGYSGPSMFWGET